MALEDNLTEFWKLDEASGNRAGAVNSLTLTDNNTVGSTTGNTYATAADFVKANSEYLSRTDDTSISTGDIDFSWMLWVYYDALTGGVDFPALIAKGAPVNAANEYFLGHPSSAAPEFSVKTTRCAWGSTLSAGQWYMIVGVHDSINDLLKISVNAGTYVTAAFAAGGQDTASALQIGANGGGSYTYFDGRMGPMAFWKRALTQAELTTLYNSGTGLTYPFLTFTPKAVIIA